MKKLRGADSWKALTREWQAEGIKAACRSQKMTIRTQAPHSSLRCWRHPANSAYMQALSMHVSSLTNEGARCSLSASSELYKALPPLSEALKND